MSRPAGRPDGGRAWECGQATVEWTGVLLVVTLVLGAAVAAAPTVDGRSFAGFLAHRIACAVARACAGDDRALARAYGRDGAALVREHAPGLVYEPGERQLPVDWRRCRAPRCAEAPDDPGLDVHRSHAGERATVFTRVLRRHGHTYIQYWLYYADSNTAWAGSDRAWEAAWLLPRLSRIVGDGPDYPGFHRDDWESYQVRLEPDGSAWARASSHGHYQGCKYASCHGRWLSESGWTRVSRGSHAGHIPVEAESVPVTPVSRYPVAPRRGRYRPVVPGAHFAERTSTPEALRLIPLETHDRTGYRPLDEDVTPPWRKEAYDDPEGERS